MFDLSTVIATIMVGGGLAYCGFRLGKDYWANKTVEFLINNGFLKILKNKEGEIRFIRVVRKNLMIDNSSKK